jgi:hypothetical protein
VHRTERLAVRRDLVHETVDHVHVGERRHGERDRAGADETIDRGGAALRHVFTERAVAARRRVACHRDLILHRERKPEGRPERCATRAHPIRQTSGLHHASRVDRVCDVECLVRVVLREQSRDVGLDLELTATDARDGFARAEREQLVVGMPHGVLRSNTPQRISELAAYA